VRNLVPHTKSEKRVLKKIRRPFEKFVDWRQYAAVMQKEAVTVMPSCSGGVWYSSGVIFIPLTVVKNMSYGRFKRTLFRMAEQQRCAIEFCARLRKSGSETPRLILQAYRDDAMRQAVVFKRWKRFRDGETKVKNEPRRGLAQCLLHCHPEACGKRSAARFREVGGAL
jgi:hypothetical protein